MNLNDLRHKIDIIDERIVSFLNERAKLSLMIGNIKAKNKIGIYAPDREMQILSQMKARNKGPLSDEALEAIYREVMSGSLSLEKPLQIACLGNPGAFTHTAAYRHFGSQVAYITCADILEVFEKVERDLCDYGVVPYENSVEGVVTPTFDLLVDSELKICRQMMMKISHHLLSKTSLSKIRKIYSNPQVFGQCRNWLHQNLPGAAQILVDSTTEAAQIAAREKNSAAIASGKAGEIYHLRSLKQDIQDIAHNTTKFLIIANQDVSPTGKDRTSILFSIKDKVGALHAMLTPFYRNKINLTKIESRPSKKKAWDYYFFVELEGHRLDKNVSRALKQLEGMCKYLKILGSYPVV